MPARFRVRLRKSPISHTAKTRGTVRALGLHRIGQAVDVPDNPQTRGMARAVAFLLEVEETNDGAGRGAKAATEGRRSGTKAETPGAPKSATSGAAKAVRERR
jgi:large subunit ribosomal protein L30